MLKMLALCNQLFKGVMKRQRLDKVLLVSQVELAEEILSLVSIRDFSQTCKVVKLRKEL